MLAQAKPQDHDLICFHCQQSAEKYLKALMQELGQPIPRTHQLTVLLQALLPHDPKLATLRSRLLTLTRYAVDFRYPGLSANARQSRSALRAVAHVRAEFRQRLQLSP